MSETNAAATLNDSSSAKTLQIVVFRLGREEYAMNIGDIKEVVRTPAITRMPETPPHIRGVANIRGHILAIVDLQDRFGLSAKEQRIEEKGSFTLVIESETWKLGVLVHEVPNTLTITESMIDEPSVLGDGGRFVKGIVKSGQRLIMLIDIFKALEKEHATLDLVQNP